LDRDRHRPGWFPAFRCYGPLDAFYDKTLELPDIEKVL
jgi:hypothetical protein